MIRKSLTLLILSLFPFVVAAQQCITLEQCRQRALDANRGLKQAEIRKAETEALEKVALFQMLPKVSANGAYSWMQKEVNLLSAEQQGEINSLGTHVQSNINQAITDELTNLGLNSDVVGPAVDNILHNTRIENALNGMGHKITDALDLNTHSVVIGAVTVSQPLFTGGKLLALYRCAQLANNLSGTAYDQQREATLVAVDEAYWQVVSIQHKKKVAEKYADLLQTLYNNVDEMVKADVATQGDLTRVRVKLNEAQMNLTKATNGLLLAKMLLAQRCGMPLDTVFTVADENWLASPEWTFTTENINMDTIYSRRSEMKMLRISDSIAQQGVRISRSTLLPNIGVTAGYLFSNPNIFDGFKNEFSGSLMAGVAVNIPIVHPGGIYAVKAAKAKRREVAYQIEEAQEMIELQVNKLSYELTLAYKKLTQAQVGLENAEENLRLADESFRAGVCSSSDLMAAQTAWQSAQSEVVDAQIEIAMSRVYLRQAMGINQ
ncbi:MAG: TolC family protein [Bacteroidales bacterium]|nr:TolC family protein [Bacteroidales bacterium]